MADLSRASTIEMPPDSREVPATVAQVRSLLALYTVTGFTGLLAEQGFERYMALLVGATASASAVVLFTYFLGFAVGSLAAARLLNRGIVRRPLLAYGIVEGLAGASCVIFSYSFHALTAHLAPLEGLVTGSQMQFAVRFLFGCLLVFPTAALMGASFPFIAAALDSSDPAHAKRWPQAYCANLAGALAAALAAPAAILPLAGVRGALWICCGANTLVAAGATMFNRRLAAQPPDAARERSANLDGIRLLLAASFASGAIFFALEVIWTHLIAVVIGCSVYAFSWMLAAILAGLLWGARSAGRGGRTIPTSVLFRTAAFLMAAQLALWDLAPNFFNVRLPAMMEESFYFAELYKLGVAALLLVPAAAVLGLIYPRLLASPRLQGDSNAHLAGYLSAANSLGCLSGALLGIFVLLPRAGSELSLKIIVLLLALFWLLFARRESGGRPRLLRAAAGMALLVMIATWHWNWARMTSGGGNYFGQRQAAPAAVSDVKAAPVSIIFRDESVQGGITTVVEQSYTKAGTSKTLRVLLSNGKFQGDNNEQAQAQFGFAAVPSLFVEHFDRALLIGLGTGHSAAILKRAGYREIDIAEFSPGIVRAAVECFQPLNENILSSPGIHLRLEDGRNVLLADTRTRYDLITVEISSVWFAGATNLYAQEFYELAKQRLAPRGVLQQWVQLHHISPRELTAELATVRSVFPYVGLWYYGSQGMMVASEQPLSASDARGAVLSDRLSKPGLARELESARILDSAGVDRLIRANPPVIITDHNRWIEYASPHYEPTSYDWVTHNLRFLAPYR